MSVTCSGVYNIKTSDDEVTMRKKEKARPVPFSESCCLPLENFRVVGLLNRESRRPEKLIVDGECCRHDRSEIWWVAQSRNRRLPWYLAVK